MKRRRAESQQGFVITMELVLIMTILGIGLLVGIVAIRNALFVWWHKKQAQIVWVYDSTPAPGGPIVLGPVRDFDEHEAPRLFFIDRSFADLEAPAPSGVATDWLGKNYRAFVGVRDDRFTSRHRIFYENSLDCGVTTVGGGSCTEATCQACIVRAGDEDGDNRGIGIINVESADSGGNLIVGTGRLANAGGIGYLYPMQPGSDIGALVDVGGPSYGIGRDLNNPANLPGSLFRECYDPAGGGVGSGTNGVCDCNPAQIRSQWTSQTVTSGLPCEPLPGGATVEAAKCPDGRNGPTLGSQCLNPADPRCVTVSGGGSGDCSFNNNACSSNADCDANICSVTGTVCALDTDCLGTCSNNGNLCSSVADCGVAGTCSEFPAQACSDDSDCSGVCVNPGGQPGGTPIACSSDANCSGNTTCDLDYQTCNIGGGVTCDGFEGTCGETCDNLSGGLLCGCPTGWIDYGANCCPPGTVQAVPGQCTLGNDGRIVEAVPVGFFNAIDWTAPFRVNLPPDPNDFFLLPPGGSEGAAPDFANRVPWDPTDPTNVYYNRVPGDGTESDEDVE